MDVGKPPVRSLAGVDHPAGLVGSASLIFAISRNGEQPGKSGVRELGGRVTHRPCGVDVANPGSDGRVRRAVIVCSSLLGLWEKAPAPQFAACARTTWAHLVDSRNSRIRHAVEYTSAQDSPMPGANVGRVPDAQTLRGRAWCTRPTAN